MLFRTDPLRRDYILDHILEIGLISFSVAGSILPALDDIEGCLWLDVSIAIAHTHENVR
uniref:Uncharacterized protein n=1 Tax=Daucus carota subsp. sativus TaxID=79200 RepID=A0A161ZN95_DAUCS